MMAHVLPVGTYRVQVHIHRWQFMKRKKDFWQRALSKRSIIVKMEKQSIFRLKQFSLAALFTFFIFFFKNVSSRISVLSLNFPKPHTPKGKPKKRKKLPTFSLSFSLYRFPNQS